MRISKYCPVCKDEWKRLKDSGDRIYPKYLEHGVTKRGYAIISESQVGDVIETVVRWNDCWHTRVFRSDIHPTTDGYKLVNTSMGYIPEHRFVWQNAHGKLPSGYVVHHINGKKSDNRLENLVALPRNKHNSSMKQSEPMNITCPHYQSKFQVIRHSNKQLIPI